MWHQVVNWGLLKDAGIFVGAYVAIQAVHRMNTPSVRPVFEPFPLVQAFGFMPLLTPVDDLAQTSMFRNLLRTIETFLELTTNGNVRKDGFRVNRMANEILHRAQSIVQNAKRSANDQIAMAAMDFERDELPLLEGSVENTLRNMLLTVDG